MSKTEHTPTPWALQGGTNKQGQLFIWMAGEYYGGHAIATVHNKMESAKANAEFICRAANCHDDLLTTIENALTSLAIITMPVARPSLGDVATNEELFKVMAESFRAAIAKAKP